MKSSTRRTRLLSMDEVADQTSFCVKTVSRWIASGELKAHRIGRGVRICEEDLASFLGSKRR